MTEISASRPLARLAVAAGIAGTAAVLLAGTAAASTVVDGNPTCADLAPAGQTWGEFKLDPDPADGIHDAGNGISITVDHLDPFTIAWSSSAPVAAFIMKGGPVGNVEIYTPYVTNDAGGTAVNPNNQQPYGISHVTWCFPEVEEPPTEVPPAQDPPAQDPPAQDPPAPTVAPTTQPPTQVLSVQQVRSAPSPVVLARTGTETGPLGIVGVALAALGSAAVRRSRRALGR